MASSFDTHRERRALFGSDVDSYDDGRPGYPDEVYQRLVDVCGLGPGAKVLEIGPGRRFGTPVHEVIRWTGRHSPLQVRTLFASFSPWLALEPALRSRVLDELEALARNDFGGVVERPYLTPIYLAQRDG